MFMKPPSKEQKLTVKKTRKKNFQIDEKQKKIDVMFMKRADVVPHQHQQLDGQKSDQTSTVIDRVECKRFVQLSTNLELSPESNSWRPDLTTKLQK